MKNMGIREKIRLGFLALGLLLFFSGLISFFELSKLSRSTQSMLGASLKNMELSKTMLDAVQDQIPALLQIIVSGRCARESDSLQLFVTSDLAYGSGNTGVVDGDQATRWFVYIEKVIKNE